MKRLSDCFDLDAQEVQLCPEAVKALALFEKEKP